MEIVNRNLQISQQDIESCSDRQQLKEWDNAIKKELLQIKLQLKEANLEYRANGEYSDLEWYKKASYYRQLQGILLEAIRGRFTALNKEKREQKLRLETEFFKNKLKKVKPFRFNKYIAELNDILLKEGLI